MAEGTGSSLLDRIVARKRQEIDILEKSGPGDWQSQSAPLDFYSALKRPGGRLRSATATSREAGMDVESARKPGDANSDYLPLNRAIISESKKASPSMGLIRPDYDPITIAETYATLADITKEITVSQDGSVRPSKRTQRSNKTEIRS